MYVVCFPLVQVPFKLPFYTCLGGSFRHLIFFKFLFLYHFPGVFTDKCIFTMACLVMLFFLNRSSMINTYRQALVICFIMYN